MAQDCALCPAATSDKVFNGVATPASKVQELFHTECPNCPEESTDPRLCDQCRHMRLRHIFKCVESLDTTKHAYTLRSTLIDTNFETQCPICAFARHTLLIGSSKDHLEKLRRNVISIFLANVKIETLDQAEIWVAYRGLSEQGYESTTQSVYQIFVEVTDNNVQFLTNSLQQIERGVIGETRLQTHLVGELIDWDFLRGQITQCQNEHTECSRQPQTDLPAEFRVIDVFEEQLVETHKCDYIALSYVWGANVPSDASQTTIETINGLKKRGGLSSPNMPAMIKDAMQVCKLLGERYLWVDRFCIIQNDRADKSGQISAMGDIYAGAKMTLIAEHGSSMLQSLPGVGYARERVQCPCEIDGLRLTNRPDSLIGADPQRVWNTRGWTYQEAILSNRRLYLCRRLAYYECNAKAHYEDHYEPPTLYSTYSFMGPQSVKLVAPEDVATFEAYSRHVLQYSQRRLTFISDVYDAIGGIIKALWSAEQRITSYCGLPRPEFHRALLWIAAVKKDSTSDSAPTSISPQTTEAPLPTWSWSWAMSVSRPVMMFRLKFFGSLVVWYSFDRDKGFSEVADMDDSTKHEDWKIPMSFACTNGCVEGFSLGLDPREHSFSRITESFAQVWDDHFGKNRRPGILDKGSLHLIDTSHPTRPFPQTTEIPGALYTRWQRAFLRVETHPGRYHRIKSPSGETIGQLRGDILPSEPDFFEYEWTPDAVFEFGGISLCDTHLWYDTDAVPRDEKAMIDVDGNKAPGFQSVWVMMVRRQANDTLQRMTIGFVFLIDWVKLDREWVGVTLL